MTPGCKSPPAVLQTPARYFEFQHKVQTMVTYTSGRRESSDVGPPLTDWRGFPAFCIFLSGNLQMWEFLLSFLALTSIPAELPSAGRHNRELSCGLQTAPKVIYAMPAPGGPTQPQSPGLAESRHEPVQLIRFVPVSSAGLVPYASIALLPS